MTGLLHGQTPTSAWVDRWTHLLSAHSSVLDLACGHGRHVRHFASLGHRVTGVDRNPEALASLASIRPLCETVCADLENGPWPLLGRSFDAVVVTNYLWRPLWPNILASLAPNGVLIYETFATGNESVGKPSRPDFLLRTGELLSVCQPLRVVAFEEGFLTHPERFVQRIVAVREPSPAQPPMRYLLSN